MASREESVDVSITAALAKIGALEKALAKAMKATVELNTTAAMARIRALDAEMTKITKSRTLTFNTTKAAAQIAALNKELGKAATGKGGAVDLAAIEKGRAAQSAANAAAVRGAEETAAKEAAAAERGAAAAIKAEQKKAAEIQALNQRLAALQTKQAADSERAASVAASRSIANQRSTLSAQLSQTRSLQNIGQTLTFGLTLPIAGAAVAVTKLGFTFEDTMNRIRVLTTPAFRTSSAAVDELRNTILKLGTETTRTPTELADGFYQIASAGVAGAVALDVLKASAEGAAIGLGSTNVIADISTSVLNAYGDSAGNAFQVTNTLAEAVRIAKGEAADFAPVLGRLLPVAKNLGISFSDVAGSAALLTRNGLSASEATTQLRGLFNSFIKPSVQARKELDRVGLSSTQLLAQLQGGDFIGALGRIKTAFGNDQLGLGRLFRNQQGLNAFLTLTRDIDATTVALNQVRNAGKDATKEVTGFALIKNDPVLQFRAALAGIQAELIKIGTAIAPVIVTIAKMGAVFLSFFNSLPSGVKLFVGLALGIAALAGPFLIAFTAVQRLTIAKRQLDLAMGNTAGIDATGTSLGRFGTILGGQAGGIIKFTGAVAALASAAAAFTLGQQLADASTGAEKFQSTIGIAGSALTAFLGGSALGGPVVGGLAAALTVGAAAVGKFSQEAANAKKPLEDLKNDLLGVTDAAKQAAIIGPALAGVLNGINGNNKFSTLTFPDFKNSGIDVKDFAKAITTGGDALKTFNTEAGNKVAKRQLFDLNAEVAKGPKLADDYSNEARGLLVELNKFKLVKFSDSGQVLGINDQAKALSVLGDIATKNLGSVSGTIGDTVRSANDLTTTLGLATQGEDALAAGADGADTSMSSFGNAADGAAISIQDLATALNDAVSAANDLNNAKLDKFTGQTDQAASFADLFETIDKNKDVLPKLNDQFDLTTQAGRDQARSAAEVKDALAGQIGDAQKRATALAVETGNVDDAKNAYFGFLGGFTSLLAGAGVSQEQISTILAASGGDFQSFVTTLETSGVDAAAAAKGAIDGLLGAIPADAATAVSAIKEPSDQVAALANQISLLPDSKITEVFASVANPESIDTLAEVVQDLPADKQVAVLAAVSGKPELQALTDQIVNDLPDEKIAEVIANTSGQQNMDDLLASVFKLPPDRIAQIDALVRGRPEVDGLKTQIDGTKGKEVFVKATTSGAGDVTVLKNGIDALHDKTVRVTAITNNVNQNAGLRIIGRNPDGSPIFGPRAGAILGPGGHRKMAGGGVITGVSRESMFVRQRSARGILWGEPETMGEAYISYARRFRGRNQAILQKVARDFGMMVVPRHAASGMVIERRAVGGVSSSDLAALANAVVSKRSSSDAPVIGEVHIATAAQTPAAFAVEAVGALGARLADRLADRGS